MDLFGWQGFSFQHRSDWCPDLLSGNRHSGLARLTGPGGQIQIKWQASRRHPPLRLNLRNYIRQLERHSRKAQLQFSFETSGSELSPTYSWKAEILGLGKLFYEANSKRSFLIEASGTKRETVSKALDLALESFSAFADGSEVWSVNGLKVSLPGQANLKSWKLVTGRTQLTWMAPKAMITAGRSAFATDLLGDSNLRDWAEKLAHGGSISETESGVKIESHRRRWGVAVVSTTLVRLDEASNELKHLSVMSRGDEWRPDWTWLG